MRICLLIELNGTQHEYLNERVSLSSNLLIDNINQGNYLEAFSEMML